MQPEAEFMVLLRELNPALTLFESSRKRTMNSGPVVVDGN
jgi:hypothetical protein